MAKRRDEDSPWKTILRAYFPEAIAFFFPHIADSILFQRGFANDWSVPPEFLDKEFQQLSPNAAIGKRYADQLVKVYLKGGESLMLLLHLEIQARKEVIFEDRMLIYAIRIFDLFQQLPCSLAILCDSNATWRPKEKILATQGSRLIFEFTAVKLLDYQAQWADLEASMNPFATVVMAHLKAQQTKSKAEERKTWKIELMRGLYQKGYNRGQIVELFKFVDWLIVLPAKLEESFWIDLKILEEETKMPFITSVEKIGYKRGQKEAIEEIVLKMLKDGVPLETIAKFTDLSISELERFANEQAQKTQF
jgi:hypothetical protein